MADRVGEQLGNYRLIRLIGRGGFAEVYLGEHLRLNTEVAIKVLHTRLESEDMENFQHEARTIARLTHPNIIRVFDFAVEDGTPFLAMDYAPNGTIRQRHAKRLPLPLETIIPYVKQMADALAYAHEQKVVHRDIKPENMLVGRLNDILLSDFGIAVVAQSSRHQGTQEMVGTVGYMAPEQIQGHPRPASDQYALGIVAYEWLCGQRPFIGGLTEVATQQLVLPPPSLRAKNPAIPPAVEEVVMTALEKDPNRRFGSTRAFAAALENAAKQAGANLSVFTQPMPFSPPAAPPVNIPSAPHTPPQPPGVWVGPPPGAITPGSAATPPGLADLPTVASSLPSAGTGRPDNSGTIPASRPSWGNPPGSAPSPQRAESGPSGFGSAPYAIVPPPPPVSGPPPGLFPLPPSPVSGPAQISAPSAAPGASAPRPKSRRTLMIALGAVLVVLLLSGGVAAFFLITQAHPVISVTSDYSGSSLGGPPDTVLHVRGQQFSSDSTITFLLDGTPAPGAQLAESDSDGNIRADVTITDDWSFGPHTFTAKDGRGFATQQGVSITVTAQPVLTVTSKYMVNTTLAGSTSTSFSVSGKRFAPNATVTFLLDGKPVPDNQPVQSGPRGRVQVTLTVTSNWSLGNHMLTAHDSQGNTTLTSTPLTIVHQGKANTPGPNGAPPDDAYFTITVTIMPQDASTGKQLSPLSITLTVNNGSVCDLNNDTGQPQTSTSQATDSNGKTLGSITETYTLTCSGTYQAGKLSYTETDTNDTMQLSDGGYCVVATPRVNIHLEGTFSNATSISGTFSADASRVNCPRVNTFYITSNNAQKGTWTGRA